MVVKIKIGRILPKNWVAQHFRKAGGFFTFQSNMWEMWKSSLSKFRTEAEKDYNLGNDTLKVELYNESETYKGKLIQWQICECNSVDPKREDKTVERFKAISQKISDNYEENKRKGNIQIDKPGTFSSGLFNRAKLTKEKIEDVIKKGIEKEGKKSVSDVMLELDIIIEVERK